MSSSASSSLEEKVESLSQEMKEQSQILRLHKRTVIYRGLITGVVIMLYILFPHTFMEYSIKCVEFIGNLFIR